MSQVISREIDIAEGLFAEFQIVLEFWNILHREGASFPVWSDFDFLDLPVKIIPHLIIVDILQNPYDLQYRFWGTWHNNFQSEDYTGKKVSEFQPIDYQNMIMNHYREVAELAKPALYSIQIPLKSGLIVNSQMLRLPMSDDGVSVNKIISVEMARNEFNDAHEYFGEDGSD